MPDHRKITTTTQVSLDGMTERAGGGTDWIGANPDTFDWELFDRVDACVLGPAADEVRYVEFANRTPHYVLSRSPGELDWSAAGAAGVPARRLGRHT